MLPVGSYPDFAACVAANQDKQDPDAFCAALEHETKSAHEPERKGALRKLFEGLASILGDDHDLVVGGRTIEKGVARMAGADGRILLTKAFPIVKVDVEERLVYGVVYEPNVPDAHDDRMSATQIRKTAHGFMIRYATLEGDTGTEHVTKTGRDQLPIVESFLAPAEFTLGGQIIKKDSWVMAAKVLDDRLWADVKAGRYSGWSFEGFGRRIAG